MFGCGRVLFKNKCPDAPYAHTQHRSRAFKISFHNLHDSRVCPAAGMQKDKGGASEETLTTPDVVICCLLKAVAIVLHFPGRATATALTYLRLYFKHRGLLTKASQPSNEILVAACIFLASKVEEVPVSNNHLLNISRMLHDLTVNHHIPLDGLLAGQAVSSSSRFLPVPATTIPGQHGADTAIQATTPSSPANATSTHVPAGQPAAPTPEPAAEPAALKALFMELDALVGDDYYRSKAQLLDAEQHLLRLLRWQLLVPQPLTALLHVAAALEAPPPLLTAAITLLHDAIAFTDMLLPGQHDDGTLQGGSVQDSRHESHEGHMGGTGLQEQEVVIAVACVLLASQMLGAPLRLTASVGVNDGSTSKHKGDAKHGAGRAHGFDVESVAAWVRVFTPHVDKVFRTADGILTSLNLMQAELTVWESSNRALR